MPTSRTCLVSFTDGEGIRRSVEVTASSLYEAAALAINEFRHCGFMANAPGPAKQMPLSDIYGQLAAANAPTDGRIIARQRLLSTAFRCSSPLPAPETVASGVAPSR